jgi:GNAT superfamily N-acetyltransferase
MRIQHQVTKAPIPLRLAQGLEGVETANEEMHIEYLVDRTEFIPTLARWHYGEWGNLRPGDSVEARILRLQGWCGRGRVPLTVIAVLDNELLGSASLVEHDMDSRLDLTPWLAGVFVAPQHRRKGIGAALVRRIMDEATLLCVSRLYLYTVDSTAFYAGLGWSPVEETRYREKEVSIMSFSTCAAAP